MSESIAFSAQTPCLGLPLLFVGQVQKEAHVNESLSRLDSLIHCVIESVAAAPPSSPTNGAGWLISDTPGDEWADRIGQLAFFQAGQWLYFEARDGMKVHNRATASTIWRIGEKWISVSSPSLPSGGTTIDQEARAALSDLVTSLRKAGILGPARP